MATAQKPVPDARKQFRGPYRRHEREELVTAIRRAQERRPYRSAARRVPV
jgi:hypothetical protein